MSDYGFATYDEKTGKKRLGSVNSKWPIFGPKYEDIKKAFKTVHIRDTFAQTTFNWANLSLPPGEITAITEYHAFVKMLIATIPHNMGFRPVGYATISGSFVKNTRTTWKYDRVTYRNVDIGAPASSPQLYGVSTVRGNMLSSVGSPLRALGDGGFDAFSSNNFGNSIAYPAGSGVYEYLSTMNSYLVIPGNNSSVADTAGVARPPYSIEMDDKNIYVYRYYYWCDVWKRSYQYYYETQYINYEWDLRARMQAIIDYAGSEFDLTIYLSPYKMEDLIR